MTCLDYSRGDQRVKRVSFDRCGQHISKRPSALWRCVFAFLRFRSAIDSLTRRDLGTLGLVPHEPVEAAKIFTAVVPDAPLWAWIPSVFCQPDADSRV